MKKNVIIQAGRLWLEGLALFALRVIQLQSGFDPATGLALPSLAGQLVWILLLICFAADVVLCLRRPKGRRSWACCFQAPEGAGMGALAAGSFLLIAGGALLLIFALPPQGTVGVTTAAAGALGAAGGAGLLLLIKETRGTDEPAVFPLLPAMFFSVMFLLAVYFPEESNPVLARYWLPVLAAAVAAYFVYHLSGFFRGEGNLRWFGLAANLTVVSCIPAAADCLGDPGRLLVFAGFAVIATAFPLLLRAQPLSEPERQD